MAGKLKACFGNAAVHLESDEDMAARAMHHQTSVSERASRPAWFAACVGICLWLALAPVMAADVLRLNLPLPLPLARFSTGDNPSWREPDFDDRDWKVIDTTHHYETQGFAGYDGYSWYRIHVVIPSAWKSGSDWPEGLRLFLSAIDDADETYLNGVRIGRTGRMPDDPGGYDGRWHAERDYLIHARDDLVRWDRDNVIAVRVYDGVGGGGFYKDMPFLAMAQRVDGLRLGPDRTSHRFLSGQRVATTLRVTNIYPVPQRGKLESVVRDAATGRVLSRSVRALRIAPESSAAVTLAMPSRPGITVSYRYLDARTGRQIAATHVVPYVLTPRDGAAPALHGAKVVGARPGSPFLYKIPATGRAPLRFFASDIPAGLTLAPITGILSGVLPEKGDHKLLLRVGNALGQAKGELLLRVGDTLALTPPMGWNSWNAYSVDVSDELVRKTAQAMIDKGLAAHGWAYVNIDDGWQADSRRGDGEIAGNARFPDLRALGDFIHARGLKFGLYSSPGPRTCGGFLGSMGHEKQDAATYARWGVDYLKYDLCSYAASMSPEKTLAEHQAPYRLMGEALGAQGRDIVYSLCQYGERNVWAWGASVRGNTWRTTDDIVDTWESVRKIGFAQSAHAPFAAPGHWNDPDMLVVGRLGWGDPLRSTRLTPDEQYSHISLWSLLAAPLLLGNDVASLNEFTLSLLTNDEVIAINQDPLGRAARRVLEQDEWQVWVKDLRDGAKAVGVFNLGSGFREMKLEGASLGIAPHFKVRDAWRQRDMGRFARVPPVRLPAHGAMLLVVRP